MVCDGKYPAVTTHNRSERPNISVCLLITARTAEDRVHQARNIAFFSVFFLLTDSSESHHAVEQCVAIFVGIRAL